LTIHLKYNYDPTDLHCYLLYLRKCSSSPTNWSAVIAVIFMNCNWHFLHAGKV